jgi:hypothetical protein
MQTGLENPISPSRSVQSQTPTPTIVVVQEKFTVSVLLKVPPVDVRRKTKLPDSLAIFKEPFYHAASTLEKKVYRLNGAVI